MTWTVINKPGGQYVECVFKGPTSGPDIQDMTARCIAIQKDEGANRFLIDAVEMEPTVSLAEVYQLPAHEYERQHVDRHSKIAVVYSPSGSAREIVKFYEMACTNRGWQARCFTDRAEAVSWLGGEIASS